MTDATFVLLSSALKLAVLFGFGIREIVLVRRLRDRDERGPGPEPLPAPVSPEPGLPVAGPMKPLPDCLVPRPASAPQRARELEPV